MKYTKEQLDRLEMDLIDMAADDGNVYAAAYAARMMAAESDEERAEIVDEIVGVVTKTVGLLRGLFVGIVEANRP